MRAVRLERYGAPEELVVAEVPMPEPGPGQVRVKIASIGVNFVDIYDRTGRYRTILPQTPGSEASGTIDSLGAGVTGLSVGQRVAYTLQKGAYAEYSAVLADRVVPLPDGVEFDVAAALMTQGLTAHYLSYSTFPISAEHVALVHAGGGGTGRLLIQLITMRGARVIATASTPEKADLARSAGAADVIDYTSVDFAEIGRAHV
jgi:NADPH2:quinone reductase